MSEMIKDYKKAIKNIRNILREYLLKHKLESLVLGVSGGADSALAAFLANPVCKELGVRLLGRCISIESNKGDEIQRAGEVGEALCDEYALLDYTQLYLMNRDIMIGRPPADPTIAFKILCGNLKARMRMMKLYSVARENRGMVLSTDNLSEFYAGFWTLHGDVGDFGMFQECWKTEVYGMLAWIRDNEYAPNQEITRLINSFIDANPTDGLGITNSDLDQLGVDSYQEGDLIFQKYLTLLKQAEKAPTAGTHWVLMYKATEMHVHPLIKRYRATMYKRNNPYNIPREQILA